MSRILLVDNYDSFTWNIRHYLDTLGAETDVVRNDEVDLSVVEVYDGIIISPGPGLPAQAGVSCEVIRTFSPIIPTLGVCLGMQAIGEVFGARLVNLNEPLHGVSTKCSVVCNDLLFGEEIHEFEAGHYHSWVLDGRELPSELEVTAVNECGLIMAIRHRHFPIRGVQFHPESVMTPEGMGMIRRFLKSCE